ncbi:unnamed protein product [Pocillopora meandrina]|uniref:Uncharacterized protein n=1 Tax=Pocillopora meandrina TaxID=46732 RepID=A0AAU9WPG7_9CNID|nr:unnamed protein product [Pocillopora meandrina]
MQVIASSLLLLSIIAVSHARLQRNSKRETKDERKKVNTLFEDLEEAENPIKLHSICEVNYEKVGCFKEDTNNRTLSQELFQDRMSSDPNYSGQRVDWANYNTYLKSLACRCAKSSALNGFTYFGLQDYGRCFSDPHASTSYSRHGNSSHCFNQYFYSCDDNAYGQCMGRGKEVNYIYHITVHGMQDA